MTAAAFYCVSDASYFLGAVGMINSLRVMGHREPIYLLDCGLEGWQRRAIEPEAAIVPMPAAGFHPTMLKVVAPLAYPAEVMVLIDSDMLVTRSLEPLIERAAEDRVVAFENNIHRFEPEWGELLGLGELRRQPYLCTGLVAMSAEPGTEALRVIQDRLDRVDFERTQWRRADPEYPIQYADQDIFNAVLASPVAAERVIALQYRLAPMAPFDGVELIDERTLRCAYEDGVSPYVLHHTLAKPWLVPTVHRLYSRLLRRTLHGDDVAIKLPRRKLPLRMRTGPLAYAQRKQDNAIARFRWRAGVLRRRWQTRRGSAPQSSSARER